MTQEYTPVAWQDETTSQQGTLINAERLNQMQTAHHFADGLEEVDAIPTADPGVEYHKIVYCTADSTIYRWDGTEWTKDIDDETKALLQQEIARATAAESELRGQLEDEHDARVDAEAAINDRITDEATELAQRIATEASTRYTADTALGTRITNETTARETADTGLGNRITAEATARAEADTALGGRIDTEQARAEAAEQANAQAIANTYTKAETDTLLASKADVATTYTKSQVDTALALKANASEVVTLNTAQEVPGAKSLTNYLGFGRTGIFDRGTLSINQPSTGKARKMVEFTEGQPTGQYHTAVYVLTPIRSNIASKANRTGVIMLTDNTNGSPGAYWINRGPDINPAKFVITKEGGLITLWLLDDNNTADGYIVNKITDTRTAGASYGFNPTEDLNEYTITSTGYNDGTTEHTFSAYVESTDLLAATVNTWLDGYLPMVRTTGNQNVRGYKIFEYKPNIASYYVINANLVSKWVKVCSYASLPNYNDMHCITRFISGHTTDTDFMFDVDIKQRSPAYAGNSALFLVNNASVRPLAINRAPTGIEVGLVAVFRTVDNTERVEIWGKFAGNRLIVTVQNYNIINVLPTADGVYKNEFSHDNDGSFITWDLNTYADEPPEGTLTQYLKKGNEAS